MRNIIRFYNQNRMKIFIILLAIIFIFVIIQLLNSLEAEKVENKNSNVNTAEVQEKNYDKESESIVSGKDVSGTYKQEFGNLIDSFLSYCKNHEPEKAYELLSQDCKNVLYPTLEFFKEAYYNDIFSGDKMYSFQSWTSRDTYIYLVKIYDNILSSGKVNSDYIQDYISVVEEDAGYKLNIKNYLGTISFNSKASEQDIEIEVKKAEIYMDYQLYTVKITNNSKNPILLDTKSKTNSLYIREDSDSKFEAATYEKLEEDLIVDANKNKTIEFKFYDSYREGIEITELVFSDIIKDYNKYLEDKGDYSERIKIVIDL